MDKIQVAESIEVYRNQQRILLEAQSVDPKRICAAARAIMNAQAAIDLLLGVKNGIANGLAGVENNGPLMDDAEQRRLLVALAAGDC
jgi:hypothetical protein